jgi:hypothetical protein
VDFEFTEITEDQRLLHNATLAVRGNHKGAEINADYMRKVIEEEVARGWLLVLPNDAHQLLPESLLGPIGLVFQTSINELGEDIEKERPTHDLSFKAVPDFVTCLNGRVDEDRLTPCKYGRALSRFIHYIVWLRRQEPSMPIYLTKSDWKAAYRRFHNHPAIASRCIIRWEDKEYVALRMTFGGRPFPSIWSDFAELACDLANDLLRSGRDGTFFETDELQRLPQAPEVADPNVPFGPARPMAIPPFPDTLPMCDVFLDDTFCAMLERDWRLGRAILPYIIKFFGRPKDPDEPLVRDACLSMTKFLAEATPEETKVVLGWQLDTRRMTIALPPNKANGWSASIDKILTERTAPAKDLEQLVGRLEHASYVIPGSSYFLGDIRAAKDAAVRSKTSRCILRETVRQDLHLWKELLQYAKDGMSMDMLTTRHPNHWCRNDACARGIGGYNLRSGRAWQLELPAELLFRASINMLEFLGSYINFALAVHDGHIKPGDIFFVETDSTSAQGWLRKTNVTKEERSLLRTVTRALARLQMKTKAVVWAKHLAGKLNDVSDVLSRDTHLSTTEITNLLFSHVPDQLTEDFQISPLPDAIVSEIFSWLERQTPKEEWRSDHTRSAHSTGTCGCAFLSSSSSPTTPSSTASAVLPGRASGSHSPGPIGQVCSRLKDHVRPVSRLPQGQSQPHWGTYQRALGFTNVQIPLPAVTANANEFYSFRSATTARTTQRPSNRKRSRPRSSGTASKRQQAS